MQLLRHWVVRLSTYRTALTVLSHQNLWNVVRRNSTHGKSLHLVYGGTCNRCFSYRKRWNNVPLTFRIKRISWQVFGLDFDYLWLSFSMEYGMTSFSFHGENYSSSLRIQIVLIWEVSVFTSYQLSLWPIWQSFLDLTKSHMFERSVSKTELMQTSRLRRIRFFYKTAGQIICSLGNKRNKILTNRNETRAFSHGQLLRLKLMRCANSRYTILFC